jgi:hypothetical protein
MQAFQHRKYNVLMLPPTLKVTQIRNVANNGSLCQKAKANWAGADTC